MPDLLVNFAKVLEFELGFGSWERGDEELTERLRSNILYSLKPKT
jgi:hypothetical protein